MKLTAIDTLHISELRATPFQPGEEFEASDFTGEELVKRGLATKFKAAAPAENKMAKAPMNKTGKGK